MLITAKDSAGLDAYRGKLAGKILIVDRTETYKLSFAADATRLTDAELDSMAKIKIEPIDIAALRRRREQGRNQNRGQQAMLGTLRTMAAAEGAVAIFSTSPRNHDGTIFVQQAIPLF